MSYFKGLASLGKQLPEYKAFFEARLDFPLDNKAAVMRRRAARGSGRRDFWSKTPTPPKDIFISLDILYIGMVSEGIFLKKIDRKAYRKLKSAAADRGVPVYVLLNEAIAAYVRSQQRGEAAATLEEIDNAAFAILESDSSLQGKWVAIASGRLVASSTEEGDVVRQLRDEYARSHFRHGIVARVGEAREEREWLAGSLQQE